MISRRYFRQFRKRDLLLALAIFFGGLTLSACSTGVGPDWVFAQEGAAVPAVGTPGVPVPPVPTSMPEPNPASVGQVVGPGNALILAHYMTWFKTRSFSGRWEHWQWDPNGNGQFDPGDSLPDRVGEDGLRQIAAVDYPRIGPYDSADPAVIEYQIASAWAAGIDGFVIDWYGPQDDGGIDRAFADTLDHRQPVAGRAMASPSLWGWPTKARFCSVPMPRTARARLTAHLTDI